MPINNQIGIGFQDYSFKKINIVQKNIGFWLNLNSMSPWINGNTFPHGIQIDSSELGDAIRSEVIN